VGAEQVLGFEDGRQVPPAAPRLTGTLTESLHNDSLFASWRNERPRAESTYRERMARGDTATCVCTALGADSLCVCLVTAVAGFAGVAMAFLSLATLLGLFAVRPKLDTTDLFEGVYDAPGDLPQFAVYTTLRAGCIEYGCDTGVVSFSDGWLHYQGLRTEFHLARDSTDRDRIYPPYTNNTDLRVRLNDGVVNATLRMIPVTRTGTIAVKYPDDLISAWHQWRMTATQGRSLYPPCTPSLQAIRKAARRAAVRKILLVSGFVVAGLFLIEGLELDSPVALITAGVLLALYVVAAQASQTARALRRMQSESPSLALVNSLSRQVRLAMLHPWSLWG